MVRITLTEKGGFRRIGGKIGGSVRPQPKVEIRGDTVFIDNRGFSVAPVLQADFIRTQTGGRGNSAQVAISKAEKTAANIKSITPASKEFSKVIAARNKIVGRGGRPTSSNFRNPTTGENLIVTVWKQGADKVSRIKSLNTGKSRYFLEQSKKGITQATQFTKKKALELRKSLVTRAVSGFDIVSGFYLTGSRLDKRQDSLNREVIKFNEDFGGKNLSEESFSKASEISKGLDIKQAAINKDRGSFGKSWKGKVSRLLDPTGQKDVSRELAKVRTSAVPKLKRDLAKTQKELAKANSKKGIINSLNRKRLEAILKGQKAELGRLSIGGAPTVFAGEFPIIPAFSIPSGTIKLTFVGKTKTGSNGRIISDIVFKTSSGKIGVAKGVTIVKGKHQATVTLGKAGKKVFSLPSGKASVRGMEIFVGKETGISQSANIILKQKQGGLLLQRNLKGLIQGNRGVIASAKGKSLFQPVLKIPGGLTVRNAPSMNIDDFISVSKVLTRGQITAITGKTLTTKGARVVFSGLIKGTTGVSRTGAVGGSALSSVQKKQFAKALKDVAAQVSAAAGVAKSMGASTKSSVIVAVKNILRKNVPSVPPIATQRQITKAQETIVIRNINSQDVNPTVITSTSGKAGTKNKPEIKTTNRPKPAQKTTPETIPAIGSKQPQIPRSRTRAVTLRGLGVSIPRIGRGVKLPPLPSIKFKKKLKSRTRLAKVKRGYNVFAIPMGKRKYVRINKVPLAKTRAEDLRNYFVDTTLSRIGKTTPTTKKARPPKVKSPKGYAKKTAKKFRKYKIVKGKKKKLIRGKVIEKKKYAFDSKGERKKVKRVVRRKKKK